VDPADNGSLRDQPRKEEKVKLLERAGTQKGSPKPWATADASARDCSPLTAAVTIVDPINERGAVNDVLLKGN
jgi:hypothetical protein